MMTITTINIIIIMCHRQCHSCCCHRHDHHHHHQSHYTISHGIPKHSACSLTLIYFFLCQSLTCTPFHLFFLPNQWHPTQCCYTDISLFLLIELDVSSIPIFPLSAPPQLENNSFSSTQFFISYHSTINAFENNTVIEV